MGAHENDLESFLREKHEKCKVAVLPDFFLDRIVDLECGTDEFSTRIDEVTRRKGGSIDGVSQTDLRGGNAINVASALISLCAEVTPFVCTSQLGQEQLKLYFKNTGIDISHVKVRGKASITTALEFRDKNSKVNVMVRDLGSLADFGPKDLEENDFAVICDSDYVCLFNWAGTLNHGTELAETVFRRARHSGRAKTYYDTADPSPNRQAIKGLVETVLTSDLIDVLALNENEAIVYAGVLDESINDKKGQLGLPDLAMESARVLSKHLRARIDLHTTSFAASLRGKKEAVSPAFKVKVLRATGAGDAWTAGNIIGDHNELSDESRLTLANAVSACYLSDPEGKHPTWKKIEKFLKTHGKLDG